MTKITAEMIGDMRIRALIGEVRNNVAAGQAAVDDGLANLAPAVMVEAGVEAEMVAELVEHLKMAGRAQDMADEHWQTAGRLLARLKRCKPKQCSWESYVREKANLSRERADELIRIAEGRTTVEGVREGKRERVRKSRDKPVLRSTGNSAATSRADDDMPTQEEADESYQNTLYEHACLIVDDKMSGETRQRFFAHVRRKYHVSFSQSNTQKSDKGLSA